MKYDDTDVVRQLIWISNKGKYQTYSTVSKFYFVNKIITIFQPKSKWPCYSSLISMH